MLKPLILYLFLLSGLFSASAQSRTDSVACVMFHPAHDTIVVLVKTKRSLNKDVTCYKMYPDSDRIGFTHLEFLATAASEDAISSLSSSVFDTGYRTGENFSPKVKIIKDVRIKKESKGKPYGKLYEYDVCISLTMPNDSVYKDCYSDLVLMLWESKSPVAGLADNLSFETSIWQSSDRRLMYFYTLSERKDYEISTGNEYYVSMTQTMILPK